MSWLQKKLFPRTARQREVASGLFDDVMAKARDPLLFRDGLLPDTVDGRFHAVALYAGLLFPRLERLGQPGRDLSRRVYKRIFDSFDAAMRETGVGDASIARKVRKMGEGFFGIGKALAAALAGEAPARGIQDVLTRNDITTADHAEQLARILLDAREELAAVDDQSLLQAGHTGWNGRRQSAA